MRRWLAFGLCFSLLGALTACGGGGSAPTSAGGKAGAAAATNWLNVRGAGREAKLYAAAKREGHLDWYTSLTGPIVQGLVSGFEAKYPGIQVAVDRAGSTAVVSRMSQEAQAGRYTADAIELSGGALLTLIARNLLSPYYSPEAAKLSPEFLHAASGGLIWAASERISFIGFGYNKKLLPAAAVPHTLEDLLKPALKGKIVMATNSTAIRWVGTVLHAMGNQAGRAFLTKLSHQGIRFNAENAGAFVSSLAQGTFVASISVYNDNVNVEAAKGAPVAFVPLPPAPANLGNLAIANHSRHPAAAMLFIDYVLSPAGRAILKRNFYDSPAEKIPFAFWVPEAGETASQYEAAFAGWRKVFNTDFPH